MLHNLVQMIRNNVLKKHHWGGVYQFFFHFKWKANILKSIKQYLGCVIVEVYVDKIRIMSALYYTNTLSWVLIALVHWIVHRWVDGETLNTNLCPWIDLTGARVHDLTSTRPTCWPLYHWSWFWDMTFI